MKIRLQDITEEPRELAYEEDPGAINELLRRGERQEFAFGPETRVRVSVYRAGSEILLKGTAEGRVSAECVRCLRDFSERFATEFSFVLLPRTTGAGTGRVEVEDEELSFFEGEELDVSDLVRERILLSLPTRPLCSEACRGLCPTCGADLNRESCQCREEAADPRWAALRSWRAPG